MRELYLNRLRLEGKSYSNQIAVRNESLFGFVDFYTRGLTAHGQEVAQFRVNNPWLQHAQAREYWAVPKPSPLDTRPPRPRGTFKRRLRRLVRQVVEPRPASQIAFFRGPIRAFVLTSTATSNPRRYAGDFHRLPRTGAGGLSTK